MEITDNKEKIPKPIRISAELHRAISQAQLDARIAGRKEPSFAALLDDWTESRTTHHAQATPAATFRSTHIPLHEKIEEILNGGDDEFIRLITLLVGLYSRRSPNPRPASAGRGEEPDAAEERRLLKEYRGASYEKRRRMLAFAAKTEDLGPEMMPAPKSSRNENREESTKGKK
jgi:hypothetical protein